MIFHAVLTSDIVNSTNLKSKQEKKLMGLLGTVLKPHKYEFYRGDSFQVYVKDPAAALRTALLCRTAAVSISSKHESPTFDLRISVGIGTVASPFRKLATAKGQAFTLSGRAFDMISNGDRRMVMVVGLKGRQLANIALELAAVHLDSIYREMTAKQAEVILLLLLGKSQQEAAANIKKSKSTISQFVSSGKWSEIEKIIDLYEKIIEELK